MASRELTWLYCLRKFMNLALFLTFLFLRIASSIQQDNSDNATEFQLLKPTIFVAVLVRNKAHSLPWFFGHLENLDYPKDRIALW